MTQTTEQFINAIMDAMRAQDADVEVILLVRGRGETDQKTLTNCPDVQTGAVMLFDGAAAIRESCVRW